MPETVDPATTALRAVPERSAVSVRTARFPSQWAQFQPRGGFAWDVSENGKSVAARQRRHLLRAAEHAQPGRIGHDQRHPAEERFPRHAVHRRSPTCRCGRTCWRRARRRPARSRSSPASACSTATTRTRASTASTSGFERELAPSMAAYVDFTVAKGVASDAVPELQRARHRGGGASAGDARHDDLHRRQPVRAAARRRVRHQQPRPRPLPRRARSACASASRSAISSRRTTCSPRTRTTTRTSATRSPIARSTSTISSLDYGPSDRDIRHKFNFFTYVELPRQFLRQPPHAGADGAADHLVAARAERQRSRPQLGSQGQRVLLARLAAAARVPRRRDRRRSSRASRCSTRSTTPTTSTR